MFSGSPAGFSGSSAEARWCRYQQVGGGGQGIGDSGAGVLGRECEICQQSCPFPITVDFQCPHKVNQVHNRRSFPPWSDGCFSLLRLFLFPPDSWSPNVCVTCLQRCSSVPGQPQICLFVCLFLRVTDGQTSRQVKQRSTALLERLSRATLNGKLLPLVFCTKGALLSSSRTIELFTESLDNLAAAAALKDVGTQVCTDQS